MILTPRARTRELLKQGIDIKLTIRAREYQARRKTDSVAISNPMNATMYKHWLDGFETFMEGRALIHQSGTRMVSMDARNKGYQAAIIALRRKENLPPIDRTIRAKQRRRRNQELLDPQKEMILLSLANLPETMRTSGVLKGIIGVPNSQGFNRLTDILHKDGMVTKVKVRTWILVTEPPCTRAENLYTITDIGMKALQYNARERKRIIDKISEYKAYKP